MSSAATAPDLLPLPSSQGTVPTRISRPGGKAVTRTHGSGVLCSCVLLWGPFRVEPMAPHSPHQPHRGSAILQSVPWPLVECMAGLPRTQVVKKRRWPTWCFPAQLRPLAPSKSHPAQSLSHTSICSVLCSGPITGIHRKPSCGLAQTLKSLTDTVFSVFSDDCISDVAPGALAQMVTGVHPHLCSAAKTSPSSML